MKLTEPEIIALLDLHAGNIVDLACNVMASGADIAPIHRCVERIRELVAMLPQPSEEAEEVRTMQ